MAATGANTLLLIWSPKNCNSSRSGWPRLEYTGKVWAHPSGCLNKTPMAVEKTWVCCHSKKKKVVSRLNVCLIVIFPCLCPLYVRTRFGKVVLEAETSFSCSIYKVGTRFVATIHQPEKHWEVESSLIGPIKWISRLMRSAPVKHNCLGLIPATQNNCNPCRAGLRCCNIIHCNRKQLQLLPACVAVCASCKTIRCMKMIAQFCWLQLVPVATSFIAIKTMAIPASLRCRDAFSCNWHQLQYHPLQTKNTSVSQQLVRSERTLWELKLDVLKTKFPRLAKKLTIPTFCKSGTLPNR